MRGNWWARVAIFQLVTSLFERWVNLGQPHQSWLDHSAGEDAATMAAWRLGNSLMWRYYGMYGHIWGWRYWCNFQRWGRAEHANPPECLQVMQYYRNLANPTMNHPQWRFILGFTTLLSNYMLWYQAVQKVACFPSYGHWRCLPAGKKEVELLGGCHVWRRVFPRVSPCDNVANVSKFFQVVVSPILLGPSPLVQGCSGVSALNNLILMLLHI